VAGFRDRMRSVLSCSYSEKGRSIIVTAFDLRDDSVNEIVVYQLFGCKAGRRSAKLVESMKFW
jgi:hypothetical protein